MKSAVAKAFLILVCTACSLAPTLQSAQPAAAEPGRAFTLRVGESVRTKDGAWAIGFEGVHADSRCAKGEQCIWAGDATVRVWLKKAGGERFNRELHTAPNMPSAIGSPLELRLLRLDPPALVGRSLAQGDYAATLALEGNPSGATSER